MKKKCRHQELQGGAGRDRPNFFDPHAVFGKNLAKIIGFRSKISGAPRLGNPESLTNSDYELEFSPI